MFRKIICKLIGINVIENENGICIDTSKVTKNNPKFAEKLASDLALSLAKNGNSVRIVSNTVNK